MAFHVIHKGPLQTIVVGFLVESELSRMRKKEFERLGDTGTESFGSPRSFLFFDPVLKLLRASTLNMSPRQVSQAIKKGIR
jgi:hypothetical protein